MISKLCNDKASELYLPCRIINPRQLIFGKTNEKKTKKTKLTNFIRKALFLFSTFA